jgi:O-antigen/teichoic acid export membrane protein
MATDNLKQQTKRGLYWKFGEQFAKYGMQFIIGILMARMLTPTDYGITALPGVFLAIAGIFASAGFGTAMVRKPELTEEDLSTSFYYSTIAGILIYILLFFTAPWIADFYTTPVLVPLIRVTALGFIFGPMATPQSIILQRRLDFKTQTKVGVTCKLAAGVIGIVMAYFGYGLWSLVAAGMGSSLLGLLMTWYVVRWVPKTGWSKESFKYLWGFGNKFIASQLLDTTYNNIAPVVIGKFYSPAQLGIFNRAFSYASMPSEHLTGVLGAVTFPVLSKMQDDEERLANSYRRILRVTAFIIFPLMMLLSALAHPFIILLVTAKWEACIILLQIICFNLMWYPIHSINLNLLLVKGRSDLFLKLEVIKKIIGVIILVATLPFGLIIYCIGGVVFSIICLIVNTHYSQKLINFGFWKQMNDLKYTILLSLVMYGVCFGLTQVIPNLWLQLLGGGIIGALVYLGGAYLLHMDELKDVKYLISRKNNEQ